MEYIKLKLKPYLKILLSLIKLKTVFDTSFENKTLSERLQDYKVKSVKGYKIVCLEGKEYKSLSEKREKTLLMVSEPWMVDV